MDSWVVWRVAASLIGAGNTILDKKLADNPKNPVVQQVAAFGLANLPLIVVGLPLLPPLPPRVALGAVLAGALLMLAAWLYFTLLTHESLSRATLLMRLDSVVTLLFSALLLGERLSVAQGLAFGLGVGGGLFLLVEPGRGRPALDRTTMLVLALATLLALESVLLVPCYRTGSLWAGLVWSGIGQIGMLALLLALHPARRRLWQEVGAGGRAAWRLLLVQQGVRVMVRLLHAQSLRQGAPVALVAATGELRPLFTLLLAAWLLGERWPRATILPRSVGMAFLLGSVWLVAHG